MMTWSINIFILSIGFLLVGMCKPRLLLFWMDQPKRAPIILFCMFLFMVAATMFGEAKRQKNSGDITSNSAVPAISETTKKPQ